MKQWNTFQLAKKFDIEISTVGGKPPELVSSTCVGARTMLLVQTLKFNDSKRFGGKNENA